MTQDDKEARERSDEFRARKIYGTVAALSAVGLAVLVSQGPVFGSVQAGMDHPGAVTSLPVSAAAATVLVGLIRALDGRFALDLPGIIAEGAAGTLICWLACVLGLSFAVRVLW